MSLALESLGLIFYLVRTWNFQTIFTPQWQMTGRNFFDYSSTVISQYGSVALLTDPFAIMILGILVLILTPYLRVIVSAAYFAETRNGKYLAFTTFVFAILTWTLFFL